MVETLTIWFIADVNYVPALWLSIDTGTRIDGTLRYVALAFDGTPIPEWGLN
jgi:hypothetical protein